MGVTVIWGLSEKLLRHGMALLRIRQGDFDVSVALGVYGLIVKEVGEGGESLRPVGLQFEELGVAGTRLGRLTAGGLEIG